MTNTDPTDEIASVEFAYIDVFATAPLTGAPLTLVTDADGLTDIQMRAIAREFNQSETTFLQSPSASGATRRLRSFTPTGQEVLGAGHNALGAWLWLAASGQLSFTSPDATFSQQIGADVLPVQITRVEGRGDVVTMDQSPPVFGATVKDRTALVEALGLDEADLVAERPAQVVSTGAGHLLVAIADRAAVDRAAPDPALLTAALHDVDGEGCYLYTHDTIDAGATAYARFFNPAMGIWEDPATGTAAGPLAALLVAGGIFAPATTGGTVVVIEQGHSMGRPSTITVTVSGTRVRVSGSGLIVAQGTMSLSGPPPVPAVVNRNDEPYLRRAITLATHARADGNARPSPPYWSTQAATSWPSSTTPCCPTTTSQPTPNSNSLDGPLNNSRPPSPPEPRCTPTADPARCAPARSTAPASAASSTRSATSNSPN